MRRGRYRLPSGRLHLGMVADIKSERWPASRRNRRPAFVGIRTARLRDFADAAVEGLVICDGDAVGSANKSFCELSGLSGGSLVGTVFAGLLSRETRERLATTPNDVFIDGALRRPGASDVPVLLIRRAFPCGDGRTRVLY